MALYATGRVVTVARDAAGRGHAHHGPARHPPRLQGGPCQMEHFDTKIGPIGRPQPKIWSEVWSASKWTRFSGPPALSRIPSRRLSLEWRPRRCCRRRRPLREVFFPGFRRPHCTDAMPHRCESTSMVPVQLPRRRTQTPRFWRPPCTTLTASRCARARGRIAGPSPHRWSQLENSPVFGVCPAPSASRSARARGCTAGPRRRRNLPGSRRPPRTSRARGRAAPPGTNSLVLAPTLHRHLQERKGRVRMIDPRMKIEETR